MKVILKVYAILMTYFTTYVIVLGTFFPDEVYGGIGVGVVAAFLIYSLPILLITAFVKYVTENSNESRFWVIFSWFCLPALIISLPLFIEDLKRHDADILSFLFTVLIPSGIASFVLWKYFKTY